MKTIEKVTEGNENQVVGPKINAHRLDEHGREIVDSRPLAPPVGFVPQESIFDQMRSMMRAASLEAANAGHETVEEANDFYIEDDPASGVPPSEYEFDEDHETELVNYLRQQREGQQAPPPPPAPEPEPKPKKPSKPPPEPTGGTGEDE